MQVLIKIMLLDRRFIRRCKQGCLQFVILKPILVVITFILYAKGKYTDGNFSVKQSYLYITIIYTVSYSMALYALAVFYAACRDLLRPYNPVPKFIMIKSVVFLTYWQVNIQQSKFFHIQVRLLSQVPICLIRLFTVKMFPSQGIVMSWVMLYFKVLLCRVSWFSLLQNLGLSKMLKKLLISRTSYCVLKCS